jgi:RHS repeat-associated protein
MRLGQVTSITAQYGSETKNVVLNASYEPFGPLKMLTFGSATTLNKTFNQNYQPTLIESKNGLGVTQLALSYDYDAIGRASSIGQSNSLATSTQYFDYDRMHRLRQARENPVSGSGVIEQYSYDLLGNRLSAQQGAQSALNYRYSNQVPAPVFPSSTDYALKSHRLNGFGALDTRSYDAAGNLLNAAEDQRQYNYSARGEMFETQGPPCAVGATICYGATRNSFNGSGERVGKETYFLFASKAASTDKASVTNRFEDYALFDESGQLLMDYTRVLSQYPCVSCRDPYVEYIYLDGMPIAAINDPGGFNGFNITEIYSDHLNTPRQAMDTFGSWSWNALAGNSSTGGGNSFGTNLASGLNIKLRFPGQQYDWQTGLNYNYMRFYEPKTGRYITSDPIGLAGGLSTYGYVLNQPNRFTDRSGLATKTEISTALEVIKDRVPELFPKWPTSVTPVEDLSSFMISRQGITDFSGNIEINANLYGTCNTPVNEFMTTQFLQTIAHEWLHVQENLFEKIATRGANHEQVDRSAELIAESVRDEYLKRIKNKSQPLHKESQCGCN